MINFVHISDSHIGPTADFTLGVQPLPCLERVIARINALPVKPDFVLHTGDVVDRSDPASYRLAADALGRLSVPVYYVTGNHDRSQDVKAFLPMGPKVDLVDDENTLSYKFDIHNHRMIVLDARGPDHIDPHGLLPDVQLDILKQEMGSSDHFLTVFIHFPPIELHSPWLDRDMLLLNGRDLHQLLVTARERLRGVFFGHVHRGMQVFKDQILYSSVGSTFCQFTAWPNDEKPVFEPNGPLCFNFVSLLSDRCIVKEHVA